MKYELIATATFGLEAVVRRELEALGFNIIKTEDGKVTYTGDERAIVRSNLWLRTSDRVLLKMAEFEAISFEELFQQTKALEWENLIPLDGKVIVTGSSVKSTLHSVPACQSIVKKAIVERMKEVYGIDRLSETGAEYKVKATLLKDRVTLTVDTTGPGLHKRGYRVADAPAPIKETLAAAMILLSFFRDGRTLIDPCCGSGTIPIEGAMIARNIAPGLNRRFTCESWHIIDERVWKDERKKAFEAIDNDGAENTAIYGGDISPAAVAAARMNAAQAGVLEYIDFARADIRNLKRPLEVKQPVVITNPPYGKRIGEEEEIAVIYKALKMYMKENPTMSLFAITSDREFERAMGRRADRRRKLYNGNIETTYYQFHGKIMHKKG